MARLDPRDYPDWPRRMTTRQAEAYCNAPAAALKAAGVRFAHAGGRDYWDRRDLDGWIDNQFGKRDGVQDVRSYLDERFGADDAA